MTAREGKERKRTTKFYQEDLVQKISSPSVYGLILRCWHDAEEIPTDVHSVDPIMRPLQRGEVGVSFLASGTREILTESEFRLVDRSFHIGDLCKRSIDDVRSGVVTNVHVKAKLEHAISGAQVEGWKTVDDVRPREQAEVGDFVVYDDWVGQVIEMYDECVVEVAGGQLVRLPELSSHLTVGDRGNDILPPPVGVQGLLGYLTRNNRSNSNDTVIVVIHTVLAIAWLALNQALDPEDAQTRKRPPQLWHGPELSSLTLVTSRIDQLRVGEKVVLKNKEGAPTTTHGREGDPAGFIVVDTMAVKETYTTVDILWQDGVRERIRSTELIPYLNLDESDCWPGDHVIFKSEDQKRPAIVQSVDAARRIATILFPDTNTKELVSLLELDPHGTSDFSVAQSAFVGEGLGVHRGDFVFVHKAGTSNGLLNPRVPCIGEVEAWVREAPSTPEGRLIGWRLHMSELGGGIAASRGSNHAGTQEGRIRTLFDKDPSLWWFGEVSELYLDGTVQVTGADQSEAVYPVERLTKLTDGLDQAEDLWGDDDMSEEGSVRTNEMWAMDEDGIWQQQDVGTDADEWESMDGDDYEGDDAMDVEEAGWNDDHLHDVELPEVRLPPSSASPKSDTACSNDHIVSDESQSSTPTPVPPRSLSADGLPNADKGPEKGLPPSRPTDIHFNTEDNADKDPLSRFDILSAAPQDHAFYNSAPAQHSKSFLARLTREYRVLASSLPESIIVRTYEDRTDLLRSLILGPENTPYEDAPFVIDWMLDSNFPNSAPIAHFWSWTGGNGRVNPNLYEEGKVCLSILGTWGGDKNEIWSAARSSLLQVIVSIQGLVLVKEPWFCEPAYEKLRGTEEGIVNSRLYSEKAYVLSRGFVRRALELPLGGLETQIHRIYYTNKLLEKVISDARALIEKSRDDAPPDEDSDAAVPRLTAGGIITLDRTLAKLQSLLDRSPP